jgi:imidazolonepropionase-like amidohydrolase
VADGDTAADDGAAVRLRELRDARQCQGGPPPRCAIQASHFGFGTDAGVSNRVIGFSEHRELELLTECGVRESDALRIATLGSAEILGRADEVGQIAPGRRADILVLRENPLESIAHTRTIDSVWLDGARVADQL